MQKANIDVHIWDELRSNDRFGFNMSETYPERTIAKRFSQDIFPSSVGIDCKITNNFSFLQIYIKKSPPMSNIRT